MTRILSRDCSKLCFFFSFFSVLTENEEFLDVFVCLSKLLSCNTLSVDGAGNCNCYIPVTVALNSRSVTTSDLLQSHAEQILFPI